MPLAPTARVITIHYRRPPAREQIFRQRLVARLGEADGGAVVTLLERAGVPEPMRIDGRVVLEPDSPVVWFTFPDLHHDIGRFHTAAGVFTGFYANVLTPVEGVYGDAWHTTDLFLDVWLGVDDDQARVLDRDELDEAERNGWVSAEQAAAARREATALVRRCRAGDWPPAVARAWTLARVRRELEL